MFGLAVRSSSHTLLQIKFRFLLLPGHIPNSFLFTFVQAPKCLPWRNGVGCSRTIMEVPLCIKQSQSKVQEHLAEML